MKDNNIGLISPCEIYYNKICAMFEEDPEIEICSQEINEVYYINIKVVSEQKANALKELLNNEVVIDGKKIIITISKKEVCECCMCQCTFENCCCNSNDKKTYFGINIVLIIFVLVCIYSTNKNIHIR